MLTQPFTPSAFISTAAAARSVQRAICLTADADVASPHGSEGVARNDSVADSADAWRVDATAAAAGDRRAFERLYRGHVQRVFSICMRMVNNREQAEELTQDVFVRAWRKLPSYRGDSLVSTWLHRVAVNVVLTQRKSDGAMKNRASDTDDALDMAPARPAHVGERLDLDAAIAQLPRGARQIFVLHDVEGFTHEEIGAQLGISTGGSKAQLHRARMLLRQALSR